MVGLCFSENAVANKIAVRTALESEIPNLSAVTRWMKDCTARHFAANGKKFLISLKLCDDAIMRANGSLPCCMHFCLW
jgi:hypothetical protein